MVAAEVGAVEVEAVAEVKVVEVNAAVEVKAATGRKRRRWKR